VGHSLGGWTALEIAGARFDPELFAQDCATHTQMASSAFTSKSNPPACAQVQIEQAALSPKRSTNLTR